MDWSWSWSVWFILAQVFGVVTICFEFISYQIKDHRKYLLVTSIGNIFWALMFVFMGIHINFAATQIMIIAALFGTLRGLIFWWIFAKNTKKRKIAGRVALYASLAIMLPFTIMAIVKLGHTSQIIIQTLGLVTGLLFIVGQYLPSKHYLRIFITMYAVMVLIGNTPLNMIDDAGVRSWNYMGIVIELAKIVSVIVFYILLTRRAYLSDKLQKVKAIIACEVGKVTECCDKAKLLESGVMSAAELERLVAKMVRYELSTIEKTDLKDLNSAEEKTKLVLENVKTVNDVRNVLITLIEIDKLREEQAPIPRMSRFFNQFHRVWAGKKDETTETNS